MQIKAIIIFYCIYARMAKTKMLWQGYGATATWYIAGRSVHRRTVWQYLLKVNICLPFNTTRHLSKRNECMCPPKDTCKNVHSSFIYNSPKLESIQTSINRRMNKSIVVYSYNGIILSNKKELMWQHEWFSQTYDGQKKPETKNDYCLILFI